VTVATPLLRETGVPATVTVVWTVAAPPVVARVTVTIWPGSTTAGSMLRLAVSAASAGTTLRV